MIAAYHSLQFGIPKISPSNHKELPGYENFMNHYEKFMKVGVVQKKNGGAPDPLLLKVFGVPVFANNTVITIVSVARSVLAGA